MNDMRKTKAQLVEELRALRQQLHAVGSHDDSSPEDHSGPGPVAADAALRAILDCTTESAALIEPDGTILAINGCVAQNYGVAPGDAVGQNVLSWFPPALAQARRERVDEVVRTGKELTYVDVARGRTLENTLTPVVGADGAVRQVAVVARDITDREADRAKLEEQRRLIESMFAHSPDFLILKDSQSRFLHVNPAFCRFIGRPREDILGKTDHDFFLKETAEEFRRDDLACLRAGKPIVRDERDGRAGGTQWFQVLKTPLPNADGQHDRILVVVRDVTERRETEARFRSMFELHSAVMLLIEPESGRIVDANEAAEAYYGYSREALRAMRIQDINVLDPDEVERRRLEAKERHQNVFVFPHRLASGQVRTVEVHSTPVPDGDRILLFSIIHDVTERVEAQEALRRSE